MSKKKLQGDVYSPSPKTIEYAHVKDWEELNEFAAKKLFGILGKRGK